MDKEQLEKLIYQAFEEGYHCGFISQGFGDSEEDWQEYRDKLAQELGW